MLRRTIGIVVPAAAALMLALILAAAPPANASVREVYLYNDSTGQCADLPGYGTPPISAPVNQHACWYDDVADNQAWNMVSMGTAPGGQQVYEFQTVKGGFCLDLPGYGSDPAGTHLEVYPCHNRNPYADNQLWQLIHPSSGADTISSVEIVNYADGLCLDVTGWDSSGSDLAEDLPLTVYPCKNSSWGNSGYDDHQWEINS